LALLALAVSPRNPRRPTTKKIATQESEEQGYMHKPFEPELSSGSLEFQANEPFHYPTSKMIADGIPKLDLLPDDL